MDFILQESPVFSSPLFNFSTLPPGSEVYLTYPFVDRSCPERPPAIQQLLISIGKMGNFLSFLTSGTDKEGKRCDIETDPMEMITVHHKLPGPGANEQLPLDIPVQVTLGSYLLFGLRMDAQFLSILFGPIDGCVVLSLDEGTRDTL